MKQWPEKSVAPTASGPTGDAACRALAISAQNYSSSVSRPLLTEAIAPDGFYRRPLRRFPYTALYDAGFANRPTSRSRDDGLQLRNAYVAAAVRCAPPANKPLPGEILNCRSYLQDELALLCPKAILALGKIAWDAYLDLLKQEGRITSRASFQFAQVRKSRFPSQARASSASTIQASKTRKPVA